MNYLFDLCYIFKILFRQSFYFRKIILRLVIYIFIIFHITFRIITRNSHGCWRFIFKNIKAYKISSDRQHYSKIHISLVNQTE